MFKAPIKMLHPLLTATQEGNYIGSENIGAIPFTGIIMAHSNESEWQNFKNNKNNEAFIDRIYVIEVPYCLRATEERQIYEKLLRGSELAQSPCAPGTLDMLARFCVLSRLREHENSNLYSKMRVYDGESLREVDPRAKSMPERTEERRGGKERVSTSRSLVTGVQTCALPISVSMSSRFPIASVPRRNGRFTRSCCAGLNWPSPPARPARWTCWRASAC